MNSYFNWFGDIELSDKAKKRDLSDNFFRGVHWIVKKVLNSDPLVIYLLLVDFPCILYFFCKLVMFCEKREVDKKLKFNTNLSSSPSHHNEFSRETSDILQKVNMTNMASWKTRIDPGDWHSSWDDSNRRSSSCSAIWLEYERNKLILFADLLLDYRFKMGR